MANKDIKLIQENSSSDFTIYNVTPEANKVLGFDSSLNPTMVTAGGGGETSYSQSDLSLNGTNGNFFICSISANASFSLSNITTNKIYYAVVKNTSAGIITITLPNTADVKASLTADIGAGKTKEFSFLYNGTTRYWQISEELT